MTGHPEVLIQIHKINITFILVNTTGFYSQWKNTLKFKFYYLLNTLCKTIDANVNETSNLFEKSELQFFLEGLF